MGAGYPGCVPGLDVVLARVDHPERTPLYGGLLIVAAMLVGLAVRVWTHPPRAVWIPS